MTRRLSILALLLLLPLPPVWASRPAPTPNHPLQKADVLPLALEDAFSFRKHSVFLNDPVLQKPGLEETVRFERERVNYKAVTNEERRARYGQYFSFWWRATRKANLTVRFEYRQQNLGAYVQAREVPVPNAYGTVETKFQVTGDDYNQDGRVIAWRAVLVENGRIVALRQSFLWH